MHDLILPKFCAAKVKMFFRALGLSVHNVVILLQEIVESGATGSACRGSAEATSKTARIEEFRRHHGRALDS